MRKTLTLITFVTIVALGGATSPARADELVPVASHRADVQPGSSEATPPLLAYLARPVGTGPFAAVVLLHSCGGFSRHDTEAAARLKSWGFVALALDSFGDAGVCTQAGSTAAEILDAYAALRYLQAQSFVAADRIAIVGFSMDALAALLAVEKDRAWEPEQPGLRAVVAYYPECQYSSGILTAPALILVGEQDDWGLAAACRKLAAHDNDIGITRSAAAGEFIGLVIYPDATHAFDMERLAMRWMGHLEHYNEAAATDAALRVRAFLQRELLDQAKTP